MTGRAVDKSILQAIYEDPDSYRTAIGFCAQKVRLEQCGKIARGWGLTQAARPADVAATSRMPLQIPGQALMMGMRRYAAT